MLLDLKSIFAVEGSVLPIDYEMDMSEVEYSGVFPLKKPVKIQGSVFNKASVVNLELKITYEYEASCDRCGELKTAVYESCISRALAVSIEGEESDTIITVEDMKFDVDEFVFSEVYLSLPMKHLCKEDCKGLCPMCGKNLNFGECDCQSDDIDPRLAKLKELLND